MSTADLWYAAVAATAVLYVPFVVRRGEAGLWSSLLVAVLLGPLAWFVWLARRSGVRRATKPSSAALPKLAGDHRADGA